MQFVTQDWATQYARSRSGVLKRMIYCLARPFLSRRTRRHLTERTLRQLRPSLVIPERGLPLESRRRWAVKRCRLATATMLVMGTGTGWDLISWAEMRPRKIIAVDLYGFPESWSQVERYCMDRYGVPLEFYEAPLEDLSFLPSCSIDLAASDAVLEHCRDLPSVIREASRVLRAGATLYAGYGPLWFGPGGDHFSGRGGPEHVYNHLLLSAEHYRRYFESHCLPNEDFQSGGRYVQLDLFSKLKTTDYLTTFRDSGFVIDDIILQVSSSAASFRRDNPDIFSELCSRYHGVCEPDDFLISGNLVRLIKPGAWRQSEGG